MFQFTAIVNQKMPSTKKILITTETREQFILRVVGGKRAFGFCRECGRETELLTIDQAVSSSGSTTRDLVRTAGDGKLHTVETDSGHLLFCKDSVESAAKRTRQ